MLEQLRNGQLIGCTRLDLSCDLADFPREIFSLADTLEVLNLSGNRLSSLPDDLPRLHKLRVLFCSENLFSEVPAVLGRCPELQMIGFKANQIHHLPATALPAKLRWLILTDNQLIDLPDELGQCHHLQKLMLAGNQLRKLPEALALLDDLKRRVKDSKTTEPAAVKGLLADAVADLLLPLRTVVLGVTGNPGQTNYAASKAGMIGFSKSLAQEIGSRGVTVNCVAPGFIESPMTDSLNEAQRETILTKIPAGRLGQGEEIAAAVVYLASDEAAYVTGQTLHVNGGMAMI